MLCGLLPFKRLNAFPVHSLTFGVLILVHWRLNCLYSWWLENMNAHAVHVSPCRSYYWVMWWFYSSRCEELMLFSLEAASFYHPSTWVESSNFSEARPALFGVLGSSPAGSLGISLLVSEVSSHLCICLSTRRRTLCAPSLCSLPAFT